MIAAGVVGEIDEGGKKRDGSVVVKVESVRRVERARPRVEVWTAVAKGGRVDEMVDQLAQVGAAEWRGLETARGVAGAKEQKIERLERIAREASKQSGRAGHTNSVEREHERHARRGERTGVEAEGMGLPAAGVGRGVQSAFGRAQEHHRDDRRAA